MPETNVLVREQEAEFCERVRNYIEDKYSYVLDVVDQVILNYYNQGYSVRDSAKLLLDEVGEIVEYDCRG